MGHCKYNEIKIVKFSSARRYLYTLFCCQSGVVVVYRVKKSVADSTKTYSCHCFLRDVPQMRHYHNKIIGKCNICQPNSCKPLKLPL